MVRKKVVVANTQNYTDNVKKRSLRIVLQSAVLEILHTTLRTNEMITIEISLVFRIWANHLASWRF